MYWGQRRVGMKLTLLGNDTKSWSAIGDGSGGSKSKNLKGSHRHFLFNSPSSPECLTTYYTANQGPMHRTETERFIKTT